MQKVSRYKKKILETIAENGIMSKRAIHFNKKDEHTINQILKEMLRAGLVRRCQAKTEYQYKRKDTGRIENRPTTIQVYVIGNLQDEEIYKRLRKYLSEEGIQHAKESYAYFIKIGGKIKRLIKQSELMTLFGHAAIPVYFLDKVKRSEQYISTGYYTGREIKQYGTSEAYSKDNGVLSLAYGVIFLHNTPYLVYDFEDYAYKKIGQSKERSFIRMCERYFQNIDNDFCSRLILTDNVRDHLKHFLFKEKQKVIKKQKFIAKQNTTVLDDQAYKTPLGKTSEALVLPKDDKSIYILSIYTEKECKTFLEAIFNKGKIVGIENYNFLWTDMHGLKTYIKKIKALRQEGCVHCFTNMSKAVIEAAECYMVYNLSIVEYDPEQTFQEFVQYEVSQSTTSTYG